MPGDVAAILRDLAFQTDAQLILVVEKDAVFQAGPAQRKCAHSGRRVPAGLPALLSEKTLLPHPPGFRFRACAIALQRLLQQKFFERVPSIICTGKGVPDLATR